MAVMKNRPNLDIYRFYAPVYDSVFRPPFDRARRRALELLALQPGDRLLIPGVGTGLDLPMVRPGVMVTAVDLAPAMLERALQKRGSSPNACSTAFALMDAQVLGFPEGVFDAVFFSLVLSVVPDGAAAFAEAWRALRPGGRMIILDKFLPESQPVTPLRRVIGRVILAFGTDPTRRLQDIIRSVPGVTPEQDEPSLLRGQYRIIRLVKPVTM